MVNCCPRKFCQARRAHPAPVRSSEAGLANSPSISSYGPVPPPFQCLPARQRVVRVHFPKCQVNTAKYKDFWRPVRSSRDQCNSAKYQTRRTLEQNTGPTPINRPAVAALMYRVNARRQGACVMSSQEKEEVKRHQLQESALSVSRTKGSKQCTEAILGWGIWEEKQSQIRLWGSSGAP